MLRIEDDLYMLVVSIFSYQITNKSSGKVVKDMKWFLNISFVVLLYISFGVFRMESKFISIFIVVLLILSGFGNILMSIISAFQSIDTKNRRINGIKSNLKIFT